MDLRAQLRAVLEAVREGETVLVQHHSQIVAQIRPHAPKENTVTEPEYIAVYNHSGGSGKTCLTRDLGHALAGRGYRVLLIDMDSQANLSEWLGVDVSTLESRETVFTLITGEGTPPVPRRVHGLDLLPCSLRVIKLEAGAGSVLAFRKRLRKMVEDRYDYVLLDCPPSVSSLALAALNAVDGVIVPVQCDNKGLTSLATVLEVIEEHTNGLEVLVYVITQIEDRANEQKAAHEALLRLLPAERTLDGLRRRTAVYQSALSEMCPIGALKPSSPVRVTLAEIDAVVEQLLEVRPRPMAVVS